MEIAKLIVAILGFGGTIWALGFGFRQYKRAEKWKRAEFVAREIKEFQSDPVVANARQLIDWGERKINLFLEKDLGYDNHLIVNREMQWRALVPHKLKQSYPPAATNPGTIGQQRFTREEAKIRDTYDQFLDYLQRFGNYLEATLIEPEEIKPYVIYWLEAIAYGDGKEDENWRCALLCYINYYGYAGVVTLFNAFSLDISPTGKIMEQLNDQMADKQLGARLLALFNSDGSVRKELGSPHSCGIEAT